MTTMMTAMTRGGKEFVQQFVTELNAENCIGCGRCYKVCPQDVFELKSRGDLVEDDLDDDLEDDEMMVMTLANGLDCIGCGACSRVCPKNCHTHAPAPAS